MTSFGREVGASLGEKARGSDGSVGLATGCGRAGLGHGVGVEGPGSGAG